MNLKSAAVVLAVSTTLFLSPTTDSVAQSNACSTGQFPVTFSNNCAFDVWLGEQNTNQTVGAPASMEAPAWSVASTPATPAFNKQLP